MLKQVVSSAQHAVSSADWQDSLMRITGCFVLPGHALWVDESVGVPLSLSGVVLFPLPPSMSSTLPLVTVQPPKTKVAPPSAVRAKNETAVHLALNVILKFLQLFGLAPVQVSTDRTQTCTR